MNNAQHRIAIPHGLYNNPNGEEVIDLVNGLILIDHLLIDGEEVLNPPLDICLDSAFLDMLSHLFHDGIDTVFSRLSLKMDLIR